MKNKTYEKIWLIGNGVDIQTGIKSNFSNFKKFVEDENKNLFDQLISTYGNDLWSNFETNLNKSNFKTEEIINDKKIPLFLEPSWVKGSGSENSDCLSQLINDWSKVINKEATTKEADSYLKKVFKDSDDDLFINLNYTDTLELVYGINKDNVIHIHGRSNDNNNRPQLGHVRDKNELKKLKEKLGNSLGVEEDSVVHEISTGREYLTFWERTVKNTQINYQNNLDMLFKDNKIKEVNIIGSSYPSLDMNYFKFLKESGAIDNNTKWNLYYFDDNDKSEMKNNLIDPYIESEYINFFNIPK